MCIYIYVYTFGGASTVMIMDSWATYILDQSGYRYTCMYANEHANPMQ